MTTAEITRLIGYTAGVVLGLFVGVLGAIRGDVALITAGAGLITTGGIAGGVLSRQVSRGRHAA